MTEWKMAGRGCYVLGLEPGTVNPIGRKKARDSGRLPFIGAQEEYEITIDFSVIDTKEEVEALDKEAASLKG